MSNVNLFNDKKKALLAYKEKILDEIKYYDKTIEDFRANHKNKCYYEEADSSDSEDYFPDAMETGPDIAELKIQQASLQTCLQATQELTSLAILQSEINVLVDDPQIEGEPPVTEPGTWKEVTAECRIDLVPFTIVFFMHTPNRKFAPSSYRGLQVSLVKASHELELNNSVLHSLKHPSDAVEVVRSYAMSHRSRRTTLAKLANKYESSLFMEPHPEGGFVLKCANLLEVCWRLENKWSPVAPFHHRMKFDLEYIEESYLKIITQAHKQLLDPSIQTDERTLLLSKIIATCLQVRGPVDSESDRESRQPETQPELKDSEVMAPPKSLPKKTKKISKDKDGKDKPMKRNLEDDNQESAKKMKVTEDGSAKKSLKGKEKNVDLSEQNKKDNDKNAKKHGDNSNAKNDVKEKENIDKENNKKAELSKDDGKQLKRNVAADIGKDDINENAEKPKKTKSNKNIVNDDQVTDNSQKTKTNKDTAGVAINLKAVTDTSKKAKNKNVVDNAQKADQVINQSKKTKNNKNSNENKGNEITENAKKGKKQNNDEIIDNEAIDNPKKSKTKNVGNNATKIIDTADNTKKIKTTVTDKNLNQAPDNSNKPKKVADEAKKNSNEKSENVNKIKNSDKNKQIVKQNDNNIDNLNNDKAIAKKRKNEVEQVSLNNGHDDKSKKSKKNTEHAEPNTKKTKTTINVDKNDKGVDSGTTKVKNNDKVTEGTKKNKKNHSENEQLEGNDAETEKAKENNKNIKNLAKNKNNKNNADVAAKKLDRQTKMAIASDKKFDIMAKKMLGATKSKDSNTKPKNMQKIVDKNPIENTQNVANPITSVDNKSKKDIAINKDADRQSAKATARKSVASTINTDAIKNAKTVEAKNTGNSDHTMKKVTEKNANNLKNKDKITNIQVSEKIVKDKPTDIVKKPENALRNKEVPKTSITKNLTKITTKSVRNIIRKSPHKNALKTQNIPKTGNIKILSGNTKMFTDNTEKENGGKISKIPQIKMAMSENNLKQNMLRISPRRLPSKFKTTSQDSNKNMMKNTNIPRLLKKPVPRTSK